MKFPVKNTLLSALVVCVALIALLFTSCNADKCATIVCAYGGVCNQGACICPSGYEGTNCETISQTKYLGNWQVFEKGSSTNSAQYEISINADTPVTKVTITNFYNYFTQPIIAYINHDTITIPNQELQGKIVFGIGYIYTNTTYGQFGAISMTYEIQDTATGRIDDFGYYPADLSLPSAWNK